MKMILIFLAMVRMSLGDVMPVQDLRAAAKLGDVVAMRELGNRYAEGRDGISANGKKAVSWWTKAKVAGDKVSCIKLAECWAKGLYVPRTDPLASHELYREAARLGSKKAVKYLQKHNLPLKSPEYNKQDASLLAAARKGSDVDMQKLIKAGADATILNGMEYQIGENTYPWVYYVFRNVVSTNALKKMIESNIDLNVQESGKTSIGLSLLHRALIPTIFSTGPISTWNGRHVGYNTHVQHNKDFCMLLINANVNINARDNYLRTPIMYAAFLADQELFDYMIEKGADISAEDISGHNLDWYLETRLPRQA